MALTALLTYRILHLPITDKHKIKPNYSQTSLKGPFKKRVVCVNYLEQPKISFCTTSRKNTPTTS